MDLKTFLSLEVVAAIIAFLGVVLSVVISRSISRKTIESEIRKINTTIELNYAQKLLEYRLEVYPKIYNLVNSMIQSIEKENISQKTIEDFHNQFASLVSKYALYFGAETDNRSYDLRKKIKQVVLDNQPTEIDDSFWKEIKTDLQKMEISLKRDIGVYLVDFQDAERKLSLDSYSHLAQKLKNS